MRVFSRIILLKIEVPLRPVPPTNIGVNLFICNVYYTLKPSLLFFGVLGPVLASLQRGAMRLTELLNLVGKVILLQK